VTIRGFEVDGSHIQAGTPWVMGLVTFGANSTISSNYVHDIALNVTPSSYGGGGIEGDSYHGGSDFTVVNNIIANIGRGTDAHIHGIYLTGPGTIANNVVHDVSGYGIHLWHDATNITIVNNTVYHNRTGGILVGGGDFHNGWTGPNDHTVVANNIAVGNPQGIVEHGATGTHNVYTNNLVHCNAVNWRLLNSLTTTNSVTADPLFVNPAAGDFSLKARSPAIDKGTNAHAPATDIAGIARPQGAAPDIGAYEYVGSRPHRETN
jgi:parallel beta-helix repeat protein